MGREGCSKIGVTSFMGDPLLSASVTWTAISKGYCTFLYRYLKESRSLLDLLLNSVTITRQLLIFAGMTQHLVIFLENEVFQQSRT